MSLYINIYLVFVIMSLVLYPGLWHEDFADYANDRVRRINGEHMKRYTARNFYIGGVMFAFCPGINILFAIHAWTEFFLFRRWRKREYGIQ